MSKDGSNIKPQIKNIVERIERMELEKKDVQHDIKDIYIEAKSLGLDTKILRKVISLRRKNKAEIEEEQNLIDSYLSSLSDVIS